MNEISVIAEPDHVGALTASDIAPIVQELWDRSFEDLLRIGRLLEQAKADVGHGGWADWCAGNLPFGDTTARALMRLSVRVDGLPDDLKSATVAVLPREYSVANQVLRLDDATLGGVIADGKIKPEMTRAEAQRVVRQVEFSRAAPPPPQDDLSALGVDLRVSLPRVIDNGARFRTIVADPAWEYKARSDLGNDRNPNQHYLTMTTDDICALPVADVADDDCVLYLWVADWDLPGAMQVINAWGFEYKAKAFTWVKYWPSGPSGNGTGYWTLSGTETCLLATRGNPAVMKQGEKEMIFSEIGPHSAKPEEAQERAERISCGPYLELFARRQKPGWTCLGNEVAFDPDKPVFVGIDYASGDDQTVGNYDSLAAFVVETEIEAQANGDLPDPVIVDLSSAKPVTEPNPEDLPPDDPRSAWYIPEFLSKLKKNAADS